MENEIRERIKELKEMGVSNICIAKKCNIHKTTMSLFLKGERELKEIQLKKLQEVLENYKFL